MEKIVSKDGTPIAFYKQGSGPPLVLVHGAGSIAKRWLPIIPALEDNFSAYAVERHGRGESGDHPLYTLASEVEDLIAVFEYIDQPLNLLGHSFGALCALEGALVTPYVHKLLLYEPPLPLPGNQIIPDGLLEKYEKMIMEGDNEEALIFFYQSVGLSENEISMMQTTPEWKARVDSAPTILKVSQVQIQYKFKPERFSEIQIPTLLMVGSESPPWAKASTEALNQALPISLIHVLAG